MISRKSFIEKTGTVLAASLLLPFSGFLPGEIETGLALYTLRDYMFKDPEGTLATVAGTGYNWVEAARYLTIFLFHLPIPLWLLLNRITASLMLPSKVLKSAMIIYLKTSIFYKMVSLKS